MNSLLVEAAYVWSPESPNTERLIGYRISNKDDVGKLLLYANNLSGFRDGAGFVPGIGETICYRKCELTETEKITETVKG